MRICLRRLQCVLLYVFVVLHAAWAESAGPHVEVHVWGLTSGELRVGWQAVIAAFERKYTGVRVISGPTERGEDLQKLLCSYVGGCPPDVFRRETRLFGDLAARDILAPLDEFLDRDAGRPDGIQREDFLPGTLEACMYRGQVYAIPESANPLILIYNRDCFREAGLDPGRPPSTWDEWIEMAAKLTMKDDKGRLVRLGTSFLGRDDLVFYITQLGGRIYSEDGRASLIESNEARRAMQFVKDMYDATGGIEARQQFMQSFDPSVSWAFGAGKIAMAVEDDWAIFRAMRYAPDVDIGIAPVPVPRGRPPITSSASSSAFFIPNNARNPEGAWNFVRFVSSPEGQLIYYEAVSDFLAQKGRRVQYPGLRSNRRTLDAVAARYAPKDEPYRSAFEACRNIAELMTPVPQSPVAAVLADEALRAVERVTYGQMSIDAALHDMNRRVQEQLDLYCQRESFPQMKWTFVWLVLSIAACVAVVGLVLRTRGERAFSRLKRRDNLTGLMFISPWVIGFLIFTAGPMIFSIAMSLCDYDVIHEARYVGIRNYSFLFLRDPLFWKSIRNTMFMVFTLPLGMCVSLSLALLLNTKVRGMSVYRTLFYLPAVTPTVAAAVLWYALLNPDGLVNSMIQATLTRWFGFTPPNWLGDPLWSKPAIVCMGLWGAGGGMIFWLAGLQGIPEQLYEAAAIDGAGRSQQFRYITIPMLTPYIFFSLITGIIGVFQIFAQALILTNGGPSDSTLFYVYYLFNNAFRYFKMGYASAQAWILFVTMLFLTLVQLKLAKKWVHYE